LILSIHDIGLTFREDTGNKRTLYALGFSQKNFIWNAVIDIKSTGQFFYHHQYSPGNIKACLKIDEAAAIL